MPRAERRGFDVAFYVPWIGPLLAAGSSSPPGGAETQIYLVARELASRGLRVCLIAFDTPEGLPDRIGDVAIAARDPYRGQSGWRGRVREALSIYRALHAVDADVYVTRAAGPHVGLVCSYARLAGRRSVFSTANVSDFSMELEVGASNRALYRAGVRMASTIVVQTDEQAQLCLEAFGREAVVIKSLAEPAPSPAERREAFLWVGRLVWYKQPLKVLELARRVPEARFRIVGVPVPPFERELIEEVERTAAELPNVEMLTPRPREGILELMDEAVAVVNTADFEGMPNIFLEGWARGVPALALSHDPDDVIERFGIGAFAEGSLDRMTEQARELWANRRNGTHMRARCGAYLDANHSPDAVATRWAHVLKGEPISDRIERPDDAFAFGKNWQRYLAEYLTPERERIARESLDNLLETSLEGKTFMDIGSGSGLFSLQAHKAGAREVISIDVDPDSVAATRAVREAAGSPESWRVVDGSILDDALVESLPKVDIVYSWGVLHHTGDMWHAIRNAGSRVAEGGLFCIAIYNKVEGRFLDSRRWWRIKRTYNHSPRPVQALMEWTYAGHWTLGRLRHGQNPMREARAYKGRRGMALKPDLVDWLGGYPYEYATVRELADFCHDELGMKMRKVVEAPPRDLGNHEIVFEASA
jgi:glycosyltransferase involved in cell wall biosynthesis/SAM-dependent methyltransferase